MTLMSCFFLCLTSMMTRATLIQQAGQRKGDEGAKQKSKKKWKIVEYRSKKGKQAKIIKFTSAPFFVHCTPDGFVIAASSNRLVVYSVKEREVYSEVVFDESTPREGSLIQVCR